MESGILDLWPYLVAVLAAAYAIPSALHALMTKSDVRAAAGWVAVVLLSPFIGPSLYWVFGVNRIRRKALRMRESSRTRRAAALRAARHPRHQTSPVLRHLAPLRRLVDANSPFPHTEDNRITLFFEGDEAYDAMIAAIDGATRSVALQTYIFDDDAVGRAFVRALADALARGVEVRVLIDAVGVAYSRPRITRRLARHGIRHALFMDNLIGMRLTYANLRCHRKILVVDGTVAFTGGMNIRAAFSRRASADGTARDTHLGIRGPVVEQLFSVFVEDWAFSTTELLDDPVWRAAREPPHLEDGTSARAVPTDPDRNFERNHAILVGAITLARRRVMLCSPYFLPDPTFIAALAVAAAKGVRVDVIVPSQNNLSFVDWASTGQMEEIVEAGCRVWRAPGPFDHSKIAMVDGAWVFMGSSNLDPRSLRLNFEIDVEITSADLAARLETHLDAIIAQSREETLATLRARPAWIRLRNRIVWLFSPYL